ncbi:MAG: nucleotidyl transferase AbiEii/AbiGii toxin family protein [Bacteroidia bacterium]|jgi:hypothetical protein|nr:nucleotidyl transferase AbiEii/AbiGii toxin family protein [Bacteroidia bacterium]
MIELSSLSVEWLEEKKRSYRKDPVMIESMIYALYLLEQLSVTGLDFIFKGGTCLVLLMDRPKRFSVDIDIILPSETGREALENTLDKLVAQSVFLRKECDERRSYKGGIPKAHYKFVYQSNYTALNKSGQVIEKPEREILLDILFAPHPYERIISKPLHTEWLKQTGEPVTIKMPDVDCIAGDKLTAFAPNTTGVPYGADKEKEILKQVFDIGCLFDQIEDTSGFKKSFIKTVDSEINYRPERNIVSREQVLWDTIHTALLIARREQQTTAETAAMFKEISKGINQFRHFVFEGNFRIDEAQTASAKAAYLAAVILKDADGPIQKFVPGQSVKDFLITHPEYNFLNRKLKFVAAGEALFYWNKTITLLYPQE